MNFKISASISGLNWTKRFVHVHPTNIFFHNSLQTTEKEQVERMMGAEAASAANEEWVYKIEVPANRYDLLCMEGMCQALNVFIGRSVIPNFHYSKPKAGEQKIIVKAEVRANF